MCTQSRRQTLFDGDTFERRGYTFKVSIDRDDCMGEPWKEHDGHGPVSDWRRVGHKIGPDKYPRERVLVRDRYMARFYDFQEAVRIARRDQWGCRHSYFYNVGRPVFVSGHKTAGELAHCAAEQDFDRLRRWCTDDWQWITIGVELIEYSDDDEEREIKTGEVEYLGGIESDAGAYIDDTCYELADQILARVEVEKPDAIVSEN